MKIREIRQTDADSLSDLILAVYEESSFATTFDSKPSREELGELVKKKVIGSCNGHVIDFVAIEKGAVVADCELVSEGSGSGMIGILVSKQHRRKGIGSELVKKCCDEAKMHGLRVIRAEIKKQNGVAMVFFSKCGFTDYADGEVRVMVKKLQ